MWRPTVLTIRQPPSAVPSGQRGGAGEDGPRGRRRAREPAIGDQQRREQPDRLLGVVGAVAEREPGGHQPLAGAHRRRPAPRAVAQPSLHRARDGQGGERAEHGRDRERDRRADDADRAQAVQPAPLHRVGAALDQRRADEAAHERVARARRQPEPPRQRVPRYRRQQAARDHGDRRLAVDRDDAADRVRDRCADEQRSERVEHGGEQQRLGWAGHAGRHERRDRVRGVVDAVGERECEHEQQRDPEAEVHRASSAGASASA